MNHSTTQLEQKTTQGLFSLFCILCIAYCIILVAIVFSVIERKQNTLATVALTNQLMVAENTYADTLATLDDKALLTMGFHRFDATSFAVRKDPIATYALLYAR